MSTPNAPLREDRPLRRGADDVLGFDSIAEGLAGLLAATAAGGLLAAVTGRAPGCGRTSFLNLLHASLVERGVPVLRFAGTEHLPALLRLARPPAGLPCPIALIDDAEPEAIARLDLPEDAPAIVAAWRPLGAGVAASQLRLSSPLLIELPHWDEGAARELVERGFPGASSDERGSWLALLSSAGSPRRALRLVNAGLAAAATTSEPLISVLAALAAAIGLDPAPVGRAEQAPTEGDAAALLAHVARFMGALENPALPIANPALPPIESPALLPIENPALFPLESPALFPLESPALLPLGNAALLGSAESDEASGPEAEVGVGVDDPEGSADRRALDEEAEADAEEVLDRLFGPPPRLCPALEPETAAPGQAASRTGRFMVLAPDPSQPSPDEALEPAAPTRTPRPTAPAGGSRSGVEQRRRRCVELAARGGRASVEELLRLLADEHPSVRLSASHALASLADPSAAPELRRLLGSPEASLRRTAAFVLGRLGDEGCRDELVRLLVDLHPSVRRAAAAALGRIGGVEVVRPLLLNLDDEHAGVRMATESALSRTLAAQPEDHLDNLLRRGDERLKRAAVRAAGRLGLGDRKSLESLLSANGMLAVEAADALGRRRETASLPALAAAAAGDRGDLRTAALAAIGRIADGTAAQGLAGLLSHELPQARDAAARALSRCPGAFEAVLPYLGEGDEASRRSAAEALGRCGDRRAIGPLLEAHDRGDTELRRAAAASLVRLGFEP